MYLAGCETHRVLGRLTNIPWDAESVGGQQGLCLRTISTVVKFTVQDKLNGNVQAHRVSRIPGGNFNSAFCPEELF